GSRTSGAAGGAPEKPASPGARPLADAAGDAPRCRCNGHRARAGRIPQLLRRAGAGPGALGGRGFLEGEAQARDRLVYFLQLLLRDAVAAQAVDQAVGGVVVGVEQGGAGGAGADQGGAGGEQQLESIERAQQLVVIGVGDDASLGRGG